MGNYSKLASSQRAALALGFVLCQFGVIAVVAGNMQKDLPSFARIIHHVLIPVDLCLLAGAFVLVRKKPDDLARILKRLNWIILAAVVLVQIVLMAAPPVPRTLSPAVKEQMDEAIDKAGRQGTNAVPRESPVGN